MRNFKCQSIIFPVLKLDRVLNTTQIIDAIVDAERAPKADLISRIQRKKTVEILGLGQVKLDFDKLNQKIGLLSWKYWP